MVRYSRKGSKKNQFVMGFENGAGSKQVEEHSKSDNGSKLTVISPKKKKKIFLYILLKCMYLPYLPIFPFNYSTCSISIICFYIKLFTNFYQRNIILVFMTKQVEVRFIAVLVEKILSTKIFKTIHHWILFIFSIIIYLSTLS